jgi:hypothetical protein
MAQKHEYVVMDMIEAAARNSRVLPTVLGGFTGPGGGIGGPPGGFIGQLSQSHVTYDTTEAATLDTPASGMSLVDNLNHIRYRIGVVESGVAATVTVIDDNVPDTFTPVDTIHFSGAGVTVIDLGGGEVQVLITASGTVGGSCVVIDDLTQQITTSGVHFDLQTEATCLSGVVLFYNGIYQSYEYFDMDLDGLGLTTIFPTNSGDSLVAVYNFGGGTSGGSGTDENAIHDNISGEFTVITEKTTLHNDDLFIIEDSEASFAKKKVKKSNVSVAASPWELVLDEDGTSFANFTGATGTWLSDAGVIKQTDATASVRRARYNTLVPNGALVFQAEVQSKNNNGDSQVGFVIGFDGTNAGGISPSIRIFDDDVRVDQDAVAASATFSVTLAIDTWYTLRVVTIGPMTSVYLDGTLLGTARTVVTNMNAAYIGLRTYNTAGWFRNIKAWTLTLPA